MIFKICFPEWKRERGVGLVPNPAYTIYVQPNRVSLPFDTTRSVLEWDKKDESLFLTILKSAWKLKTKGGRGSSEQIKELE